MRVQSFHYLLCITIFHLIILLNRYNIVISKQIKSFKPYLIKLMDKQDLTAQETEDVWDSILEGSEPISTGALLTLLRAKG